MTRKEILKICKVCENQKFDLNKGIICKLTNQPGDFEESCDSYIEDSKIKLVVESTIVEKEILNNLASQGTRFANHLIDLLFLFISNFIFRIFLFIIFSIFSPRHTTILEQNNFFINYSIAFFVGMVYFTFLETVSGRTIAKYITKTKVVNELGEKPNFKTILIRSLCRFIPFEAFSFFGDEESSSGWHDSFSKTKVVSTKNEPKLDKPFRFKF